jgi:hypothetical protein
VDAEPPLVDELEPPLEPLAAVVFDVDELPDAPVVVAGETEPVVWLVVELFALLVVFVAVVLLAPVADEVVPLVDALLEPVGAGSTGPGSPSPLPQPDNHKLATHTPLTNDIERPTGVRTLRLESLRVEVLRLESLRLEVLRLEALRVASEVPNLLIMLIIVVNQQSCLNGMEGLARRLGPAKGERVALQRFAPT